MTRVCDLIKVFWFDIVLTLNSLRNNRNFE
ncbi:hypothetical protein FHS81_000665 [Pseudochelatococcus contaminans]|uniref:Uncharacterized protein n=1 Tax=Pseudochelatococcus contaminans TaxID=1538103 RepID=A0A7W6EF86_9HYPH|nr:hypothetical protein [Pseudochelatococcus contaminans]